MDIEQALDLLDQTIGLLQDLADQESDPYMWKHYEELIAKHRVLEAQIRDVYCRKYLNG